MRTLSELGARPIARALAFAASLSLASCTMSLFGPYDNPAEGYSAEVVWTKVGEAAKGLGFVSASGGGKSWSNNRMSLASLSAGPGVGRLVALFGGGSAPSSFLDVEGEATALWGSELVVAAASSADGYLYALTLESVGSETKNAIRAVELASGAKSFVAYLDTNRAEDIEASPDGRSLYVSSGRDYCVFRYLMSVPADPAGAWSVAAGIRGQAGAFDAAQVGAATEQRLGGPRDLAVAPDGTLYFADLNLTANADGSSSWNGATIRALRSDGALRIVAGAGDLKLRYSTFSLPLSGSSAVTASLADIGGLSGNTLLAVDPAGRLFIYDNEMLFRAESDGAFLSRIGGRVPLAFEKNDFLFDGVMGDWTGRTGALPYEARELDLEGVFDLVATASGLYLAQGGEGLFQGVRVLRLRPRSAD